MEGMQALLPPFVEALPGGVYTVDTGFQRDRFDAAYLVVQDGRAAFVDTGTNFGVPRLLAALDALGLARDAVDWIIPTHVHLDHAGGVGLLATHLPAAKVVVHPRGARHLIDPAALWQGALAVYGEAEMQRSYGELVPVPAERVMVTSDGMTLPLAGRTLEFADTAGHAKHHHCVWDAATRGWFSGDTFGISYREFDTAQGPWCLPTSTPVQFEPEVLKASVQRLLAKAPESVYLTHYGRIGEPARVGAQVLALLDDVVALGLACRHAADRDARLRSGLLDLYARSLAAHDCRFDRETIARLLEVDIELNAQGMVCWLDRPNAS